MNEDYLWDKTGSDAEIESLENALSAFRYQETAPPELTAKVLPFQKNKPHKATRYLYAIAAGAILSLLALGAWFQLSVTRTDTEIDSAKIIQSPNIETLPAPVSDKPLATALNAAVVSKQITPRKFAGIKRTIPAVLPRRTETKSVKAQNAETKKPDVRLTDEEQYAFDRLMLALSITSSKLKMVKDKVEGF